MRTAYSLAWIVCLLTASAKSEIPSKGKHTRVQDAQQTSVEDADMPRFAEPIANVTVSIGRDALLACVVENLKGYKVAWVRVDTQTILSIHHNVISQNNRISLTYNDHRSWYLHIKEVEETDRGWYMCQVNTDPMRSRKGYLQVVVPPMIVEAMTSNDMVVREGLNVTLMCKARGYPEPYVMWRREDGEEMLIGGEHVNVVDGELLHITKVSRLHMAAYLCVASNGVPPSISKRVHLRVQFPPMLSIPNQLEGAYLGQNVVLGCHTEAYPASINYWTTERGDMIISDTSRAGDKYETTSTVSGYTKYMKLKIRSVGPNDFGTYRCVAKNSLGETDGNIKLDEMPAPTTAVISEVTLLNRTIDERIAAAKIKDGKRRNRNKFDLNALSDYGVEEWRDGAAGNGNTGGDNNQTPERNPPGAFHNSAGALAQHNLLGSIIHGIKMQSFGILGRLSSYFAAVGDGDGGDGSDGDDGGSNAIIAKTAEEVNVPNGYGAYGGDGSAAAKLCCLQSVNTRAITTAPVTTTTATATTIKMATIRCEMRKTKNWKGRPSTGCAASSETTTHIADAYGDNGSHTIDGCGRRDAKGDTSARRTRMSSADMTMLRYDANNHDKSRRHRREDNHNHDMSNNKGNRNNNSKCIANSGGRKGAEGPLSDGGLLQIIGNIVVARIVKWRASYVTNWRTPPEWALYAYHSAALILRPLHRQLILCICIAVIMIGARSKRAPAAEAQSIAGIINATFSINQNRQQRVGSPALAAAERSVDVTMR